MPTPSNPMPPPNPYASGSFTAPTKENLVYPTMPYHPRQGIKPQNITNSKSERCTKFDKFFQCVKHLFTSSLPYFLRATMHALCSFLKIAPIPLLLTFISWTIACFPIENNPLTAIISITKNISLLIILLVPTTISAFMALTALDSSNKNSKPIIELEVFDLEDSDLRKNEISSSISKHLKIFASLLPVSTAVAFTFVLYHYKEVAGGDIGLALQITSAQLPEQKVTWATVVLVYIAIFYISLLPAIILPTINHPKINRDIHRHILIKRQKGNEIPILWYYLYLTTQSAILTIASSFTIFYILRLTTRGDTAETLLFVVTLSITACTIPISHIITNRTIKNNQFDKNSNQNRVTLTLFISIFTILVLYLSYISPRLFLEYMPKNIGGIIANPGETIESGEIDYSCVFPRNNTNSKSIAFGIIVSTDNSSILLFSPSYDNNKKNYATRNSDGYYTPNKIVENRTKYTEGFYIEKYDRKKHTYNEYTGQCEHIIPNDLKDMTFIWNVSRDQRTSNIMRK